MNHMIALMNLELLPGDAVWLPLFRAAGSPNLITITGGGGKTSLMYFLAALLKQQGIPVVITTTTKLFCPAGSGHRLALTPTKEEFYSAVHLAKTADLLTIGREIVQDNRQKVAGVPPEWLNLASDRYPDIVFLVEGDGSAGKSLKGYFENEPVIPSGTKLLIPVLGIDAVGRPLNEAYVHRCARAAELLQEPAGVPMTVERITKLVLAPAGYFHNCPPFIKTVIFVNKVETGEELIQAQALSAGLLSNAPRMLGVVLGSMRKNWFCFFTN